MGYREAFDMPQLSLDFYGVGVNINGPISVMEQLYLDFSYFKVEEGSKDGIEISLYDAEPPYERVPVVRASLYRPDSVSFDKGKTRFVDYHGKALGIYDYDKENGELFSKDANLLHELSYLVILSRVGEALDKKGLHRAHACAFSFNGEGVLCLMPQGGGKTTLYLEVAKHEGVKLLADDIPLISKDMRILPFPLRVGVTDGTKLDIPPQYLGSMERRRFGRKILIDAGYFSGKLSEPVKLRTILVCEREFSKDARIVKAGFARVYAALLRDCIIGVGLPQVLEYFLRFEAGDMLGKYGILVSRKMTCLRAILRARTCRFIMGSDKAKNAETLVNFLRERK